MFSSACATLFDQYCLCPSAFCIQEIELNKAQWSALFEPYLFFEEYKNYLQIDINAADADDLLGWRGWVESRLRQLTLKVNVGFLYGNTKQKFYAATLNIYFDLLYLPSQVAHPQALDISGVPHQMLNLKSSKQMVNISLCTIKLKFLFMIITLMELIMEGNIFFILYVIFPDRTGHVWHVAVPPLPQRVYGHIQGMPALCILHGLAEETGGKSSRRPAI